MDITEASMRYFVWSICNCSYGWKKTQTAGWENWNVFFCCQFSVENFILEYLLAQQNIFFWVAGPFRCGFTQMEHTWKLVSVELAAKEQVNLFKTHLDFQMYLDRPSICSKNQIPPVNHCFFNSSLLSLCIQSPSVSPGYPPAPLYLSWQFQMGKLRVLNFQPSSFSDHSQLLPQVWAGTKSTGQIPVLLSRTERIFGRDREVDNAWECVQTRRYLSFYTLQCLLVKINKIVKN